MRFFEIILFTIYSSVDVNNDWHLLKSIYVKENERIVIKYVNNSKDTLLKIKKHNSSHSFSHRNIFKRGFQEYIILPLSIEQQTYDVFVKNKNLLSLKLDISIEENLGEDELNYFKLLSKISQKWGNLNATETEELIKSIDIMISEKNPSSKNEIILTYLKCKLLYDSSKFEQVIHQVSNINFNDQENYINEMVSLNWLNSMSQLNLGNFDKAIQSFKHTLRYFEKHQLISDGWQLNKAEIHAYLGLALSLNYFHRQKKEDGFNELSMGLSIANELNNDYLISEILYLLGSFYSAKQDWIQALATLDTALEYVKKANTSDNLVGIYNQKAIVYRQLRQLHHSIYFFRKSIATIPEGDKATKANIYNNIASIYEFLGDLQKAKRYFHNSQAQYILMKSSYGESMVLKSLGRVHRKMNNVSKAIDSHIKSINYFKDNKELGFLEVNVELAKDYYEQRNFQIAQEIAIKVLLTSKYEELNGKTRLLLNFKQDDNLFTRFDKLSEYNLEFLKEQFFLNNLKLTNEYELRALLILANTEIYELNYDSLNYFTREFENGISKDLMPIYDKLGWINLKINILKKEDDIDALTRIHQKAIEIINTTRAQFDVSDLALHWTEQAQFFINEYINVLTEQKKYQEIFALLEKYYAINLREQRFNQIEASIKRKSQEIQQALDNFVRMEREVLLTEDSNIQQQADEAKEHFLALNGEEELEKQKIELKYLNIVEVQSQLGAGQLLLRYYVNDNNAFVFVIDQQQWQVMEVPSQIELQPLIQQLITNIKNKDFKSLINNQFAAELLPLEHIQQGNYEKLIIIADGITNLIPFTMLNIGEEGLYQPLTSIIDVERTYSASDYFTDIPESDHDKRSISIFANPVFLNDIDDHKIRDEVDKDNLLWTFDNLPSTGIDAQNITDIFNDFDIEFFTKSNATNENFLSEANRNANIIHIGTHGFFNDKALDNVGIATSIIDDNGQRAPGALAMREILYQPFKANLAVVGGCETTRGKAINGEGFNSLSRGLLSQGVNAVIGTIWSIPDRATSVFMKEFYTNLRDLDGNVSKALNLSKRNFATQGKFRRYRHPYYWAGFVLTSSNRNISENIF